MVKSVSLLFGSDVAQAYAPATENAATGTFRMSAVEARSAFKRSISCKVRAVK